LNKKKSVLILNPISEVQQFSEITPQIQSPKERAEELWDAFSILNPGLERNWILFFCFAFSE